jgi:hypothetical protein
MTGSVFPTRGSGNSTRRLHQLSSYFWIRFVSTHFICRQFAVAKPLIARPAQASQPVFD